MAYTTAVQSKPIYLSKTFWINIIVALLAVIGELQSLLPAFTDILVIPADATRWLMFAVAVLNIVLRRISDQPVRVSTEPEPVNLPAA